MVVLSAFVDVVLVRFLFFKEHADCMKLMCFTSSIVMSADAVQQVDLLRRLVSLHFYLYVRLYGIDAASKTSCII